MYCEAAVENAARLERGKAPRLMFLVDHRYRIYAKEGGNVHVQAMIRSFGEFAEVVQPSCPISMPLLRWVSRNGRPRGAWKLLEAMPFLLSIPEKLASYWRHRPALVYARHEISEVPVLLLLRLCGARIALEVNALVTDEKATFERKTLAWWARRLAERLALATSHRIFCISGYLQDQLQALGVASDKLTITHNGIHPEDFPAELLSAHPEATTIGFIGTIHRWHGVPTLVRAFAEFRQEAPAARLLIIGPEAPEVLDEIRALGLEEVAEVTGHLPRPEALRTSRRLDVAVLANTLPHGSPLKIFEYMALGKAIVAPRTPAIEEVLTDGDSGLLIEPGSQPELVAAFRRLFADPVLRDRLGTSARKAVLESHTWRHNAVTVLRQTAPQLLAE